MPKYISSEDLVAVMKSKKVLNRDYCIIDVRDEDWYGGNIKGSQNSPSHNFTSKVNQLVKDTKDIPFVVFHCTMSQARAPRAARMYMSIRQRKQTDGEEAVAFHVVVLRGGFQEFQVKFCSDPKLIENWDAEIWT